MRCQGQADIRSSNNGSQSLHVKVITFGKKKIFVTSDTQQGTERYPWIVGKMYYDRTVGILDLECYHDFIPQARI